MGLDRPKPGRAREGRRGSQDDNESDEVATNRNSATSLPVTGDLAADIDPVPPVRSPQVPPHPRRLDETQIAQGNVSAPTQWTQRNQISPPLQQEASPFTNFLPDTPSAPGSIHSPSFGFSHHFPWANIPLAGCGAAFVPVPVSSTAARVCGYVPTAPTPKSDTHQKSGVGKTLGYSLPQSMKAFPLTLEK